MSCLLWSAGHLDRDRRVAARKQAGAISGTGAGCEIRTGVESIPWHARQQLRHAAARRHRNNRVETLGFLGNAWRDRACARRPERVHETVDEQPECGWLGPGGEDAARSGELDDTAKDEAQHR